MKGLFQHSQTSADRARRAFSMVELVGVLAIVTILVASIVPTIIRRVDEGKKARESADLDTIAAASTQYILRNTNIPAISLWASNIANEMSLPVSSVTTNSRRFARLFMADPTFNVSGTNINSSRFAQGVNGAANIANARVVIVSSTTVALPSVVTNSTEFNALWNWNSSSGTKPATTTWTNWTGKAGDLLVKRVNLQPLFYQLCLANRDLNTNAAFSVNTTNTLAVTNGAPWRAYYLGGSTIGLRSNSVLQTSTMLQASASYVFENGYWGEIGRGRPNDFNAAAAGFTSSVTNPNAAGGNNKGGDQNAVLSTFTDFMTVYVMWANDTPSFASYGTKPAKNLPMWNMLQDAGSYMLGNAGQNSSPNSYTGLLSN